MPDDDRGWAYGTRQVRPQIEREPGTEGMAYPGLRCHRRIMLERRQFKGLNMLQHVGSLLVSLILIVAFFVALTTRDAQAYIDPGSGALLVQILLASLFATLFSLKLFYRRILASISGLLSKAKVLRGSQPAENGDFEGNIRGE